MQIEFKSGVYLPEIDLWLDAHGSRKKATGFVSHAHGDHAFWHGHTICSSATLRFMRQRQPSEAKASTPAFMQSFEHGGAKLTLLPAGHIAGSAQLLVEHQGQRLLYSGDFKLRPDPSCEPIVVPEADILIMETTFGQPHYLFPPLSIILEKLALFCQQAIEEGAVPVLLVYSLGKAQEILKSLEPWKFEFVLHPSIAAINEVYTQLGYRFPVCHVLGKQTPKGRIVVCPPQGRNHAQIISLPATRCAFLSGWAMDRSARYRFRSDEAFPVSDHADFSELLAYVQRVKPKKVYTHHGFAKEFAAYLRRQGYQATSLGEEEQLELGI